MSCEYNCKRKLLRIYYTRGGGPFFGKILKNLTSVTKDRTLAHKAAVNQPYLLINYTDSLCYLF